MKRAYTAKALRWHPDRQDDPRPEVRQRSELHMAELNAAWEVLRNPASRAAYDRSLAGEDLVGPRRRSAEPDVHRQAAVLVPDLGPRRADRPGGRVPSGCLWAIALGVAGVVAVAALIALGDDGGPPVDVRTREALGRGACVIVQRDGTAATVLEVPCDQDHDAVVVDRTTFPQPCPSGTTAILLDDNRTVVCLEARGG